MKTPSPHYHGHRQRLKGKYLSTAPGTLQDYEILELLLSYSIPRKDVKPLAKALLLRFSSLKGIMDAPGEELMEVPGIGSHTAVLIRLVRELGTRYLKEKVREKTQISCTTELIQFCNAALGGLKDERFCVIYLNAQNRMIDMDVIEEGIVNQAIVYPRKVLESALKRKASAIILVHNHPSGQVKPSDADIRLTHTIREAAKALDILVHDHLIVGENRFFSFREEGMIG
ncbi:MAG: DNA repair protein RadC [Deltaproteobacteria bacterium]|nr:DNA repair protein RadC [Deltaproteobacteria bacterium]